MVSGRILSIQDISCVGRCSLSVALPVLSVCGLETCVLPSAILSNHTGGFAAHTYLDLSREFDGICAAWQKNEICFDAVCTGYLGKSDTVAQVERHLSGWLKKDGLLIVDPAMADHGKLYSGLDDTYVRNMQALCERADILLPNLTEAYLLLGRPYCPHPDREEEELLLDQLSQNNAHSIILTGVHDCDQTTGVAVRCAGKTQRYIHPKQSGEYPGTGDLFAAAFAGAYLRGKSMGDAAVIAADFVAQAVAATENIQERRFGVRFEAALPNLLERLG